jgi:hypothetical protein
MFPPDCRLTPLLSRGVFFVEFRFYLLCAEPYRVPGVCGERGVERGDGMAEWFRGKRVLIVDEDYIAASRLETHLLHCGALVVGPVSSSDEAFRCLVNEDVDAAVLSPAADSGRAVMISNVLSRLGIPFVFLSREATSRVPEHHGNLVVSTPGDARTIARLLAQTAESGQDNISNASHHLSYEVRR